MRPPSADPTSGKVSPVSHAEQSSKRRRLKTAVPALGAAAGLSLSLAGAAPAGAAPHMPTLSVEGSHRIVLAEEEISDVSLATFSVVDKERSASSRSNIRLARGGCGGGGCGGGGFR